MELFWSYRSLPELAGLPKPEQDRLWAKCLGKLPAWQVLASPVSVYGGGALALAVAFGTTPAPGPGVLLELLCFGVCTALAGFAAEQITIRAARPHIRAELGLCPACGYSLAGNASGVCPECGTPVTEGGV